MVPVSHSPIDRSFAAQLAELRTAIASDWQPAAPHAGFTSWACTLTATALDLPSIRPDQIDEHRWSEAPLLSAVGYLLPHRVSNEMHRRWADGFAMLSGRDPAPADRNSFLYRPAELLGLAVGAAASPNAHPAAWLHEVLDTHQVALERPRTIDNVLNLLAAAQLGNGWLPRVLPEPVGVADAAATVLLEILAPDRFATVLRVDRAEAQQDLLAFAATNEQVGGSVERAVVYVALHQAVAAATRSLRVDGARPAETVETLCRRLPLLVAGLTRRHGNRPPLTMEDEYDVQDLLGAVLRLHFDDVRAEEWNPSYGGRSSRSDFLLKPERVVVEVKMTRKGLDDRKVIEQLTVDREQYARHPDCSTLVCVVYDPDRRIGNPTAIETDLSHKDGPLRTVVIVTPRNHV